MHVEFDLQHQADRKVFAQITEQPELCWVFDSTTAVHMLEGTQS